VAQGERRRPPLGCARPESIAAGACAPFLACVREHGARDVEPVWSRGGPVVESAGCAEACAAFARCYDMNTAPDPIDQCTRECERALDEREQRIIGRCAAMAGCEDVMACVLEMPGAGP
jgi:hypothetical protein